MKGRVYLIGAGPGNPGLLTLRGAELLSAAEVVLYDGLSNADLLRHAPTAEQICVGKHGQSRIWRQDEIIAEMLRHALAGKRVARLKGGDPAVFARTAEEVEALQAAGVPFEVVPGITAALAAGSFAGIPVTHRGLASAVALVTGHEEPNKPESSLDWEALARFPGTLVVYMGVTTAPTWTRALVEAGKPQDTPVAIVRRCSLPDQHTIHCRLSEVTDHLGPASRIRPPVIVIVGDVTRLGESENWLQGRPLAGQTIMVTRPAEQAESLAGPLRELGAAVVIQPAIEVGPPPSWSDVDSAIEDLAATDLVVFCSRNGVRFFCNRLFERGGDARDYAGTQLAVVGRATADALAEFQLRADLIPPEFHANSLAEQLADNVAGKRVTIIRASRGRNDLAERLSEIGAQVRQVIAYEHRDVEELEPMVQRLVSEHRIDWVTITSSESARNLHRLLGDEMSQMKIATISPVTSAAVQELGLSVAAEADPHTIPSLIDSLMEAAS